MIEEYTQLECDRLVVTDPVPCKFVFSTSVTKGRKLRVRAI
jgi:hypothetical protein